MIVAAWAVGRIEKAWFSIGSFIVTSDSLVCCIFGRDGVLRQKKGGHHKPTPTTAPPDRLLRISNQASSIHFRSCGIDLLTARKVRRRGVKGCDINRAGAVS